jgi:hypothetical protein
MTEPRQTLRNPVASPVDLIDLAEANVPDLVGTVNSYCAQLPRYLSELRSNADHPALLVIGTVAINDFNDLLFDCLAGRGRAAMRTARSLFEHHLNLLAVNDDNMRARFFCHTLVGTALSARWSPIESFLTGKALKGARHRRRSLQRDNRPGLNEAIAEYGSAFVRQWHPLSLRTRAERAGLLNEYDFFRAASSEVHGSASASEGSIWWENGEPTLRIGPSVVACPYALAAGLRFITLLVEHLEGEIQGRSGTLRSSLDAIGLQVEDFCKYTNGLEIHLFAVNGAERPSTRPQRIEFAD